jgi:hypothetical protein
LPEFFARLRPDPVFKGELRSPRGSLVGPPPSPTQKTARMNKRSVPLPRSPPLQFLLKPNGLASEHV